MCCTSWMFRDDGAHVEDSQRVWQMGIRGARWLSVTVCSRVCWSCSGSFVCLSFLVFYMCVRCAKKQIFKSFSTQMCFMLELVTLCSAGPVLEGFFYLVLCCRSPQTLLFTQSTLLSGMDDESVAPLLQQGVVLALVSQLRPCGIDSWNASTAYRDRGRDGGQEERGRKGGLNTPTVSDM